MRKSISFIGGQSYLRKSFAFVGYLSHVYRQLNKSYDITKIASNMFLNVAVNLCTKVLMKLFRL